MTTDKRKEYFYVQARRDGEREQVGYQSWSGTDVAEAEFYRLRRQVWIDLADGMTPEDALAAMEVEWRRYATKQNAEVAAAPKLARGGSAGLSSMHHRWVSPDKVQEAVPFVHTMYRLAP